MPGLSYRTARRVVVAIVGGTLLLGGLVLVFMPGPGILGLSLGLAVLAAEFAWARRWLRRLKETVSLARSPGRAPEPPAASDPANPLATLVLATDLSESAAAAADWGALLARRHAARLVITCAVGDTGWPPTSRRDTAGELESLATLLRGAAGIPVRPRVVEGSPLDAVPKLAEEAGADLLVIGTRGRSGARRMLLGSTAAGLVERSSCPVLSVPADASVPSDPLRALLLPLDFSIHSLLAAEWALRVATPQVAELTLHLLHVLPRAGGAGSDAQRQETAREKLAAAAQAFRRRGHRVEQRLRHGEPGPVVEAEAAALAPDLLALGTRGHGAVEKLLLGSTTRHVLPRVSCPVLTLHRPG